ncbi:MAG: MGMT family protein [Syntrophales bacterium]|nr:MGMT family protein [Syntrophales bacterium]
MIRLVLPSKSEVDNYVTRIPVKKNIPTDLMSLCETLKQYFQGQDVNFPLHLLHYDICSPFQRQVFMACTTIPRGKVITYGTLAKHLGDMRLSRAVGQTLAKNPFPIVIPCHRVVYFNGYIGGFSAGKDMKLWLLKNEGIYISKDRIRMENYLFDF